MTFRDFLIALAAAVALNVFQAARARVLSRDWAWGLRPQGAWHWTLLWAAPLARIVGVGIVSGDLDNLKGVNRVAGETRANAWYRLGLRASDLYRTQQGDELAALVWPWQRLSAADVAALIAARLARVPLTAEEQKALGGPITMTMVVCERTHDLRGTLPALVAKREAMKAAGRRGQIEVAQ